MLAWQELGIAHEGEGAWKELGAAFSVNPLWGLRTKESSQRDYLHVHVSWLAEDFFDAPDRHLFVCYVVEDFSFNFTVGTRLSRAQLDCDDATRMLVLRS